MLIQSGSGKVYAVLAKNEQYSLSLLPAMQVISTTVILVLRCRYVSEKGVLDPMLVPKRVLAGGVERAENSLRSTSICNTGITVDKVGKSFPMLMAEKIKTAAGHYYLQFDEGETPPADGFLTPDDLRHDFEESFAQLLENAISPIYPTKDFSTVPFLGSGYDFSMAMEKAGEVQHTAKSVKGNTPDTGNVMFLNLGDHVPADD